MVLAKIRWMLRRSFLISREAMMDLPLIHGAVSWKGITGEAGVDTAAKPSLR